MAWAPEQAIDDGCLLPDARDTRDNDTVAAIVGSAVGALHGAAKLPEHLMQGLTGNTQADDSGALFRLLDRAKVAFGSSLP